MPNKTTHTLEEFLRKEALDDAPPPERLLNSGIHLGVDLAMARYLSLPWMLASEWGGFSKHPV